MTANNGKELFNGEVYIYHTINCVLLLGIILISDYFIGNSLLREEVSTFDPWLEYGWFTTLLYFCRCLPLLGLPQAVFNFLGLIFFQSFPQSPQLNKSFCTTSRICFRVVTRGDYPELVRNNVYRNINICTAVGLSNYYIEVVTDKSISIVENESTREVVVPSTYTTLSGAMFKARALQYALEDEANLLKDDDWIVHLDEETILTEGSVVGIVNFINEGKHQFGQGVITYANLEVENYFLTLCDAVRVAEDMGKIQFQLKFLHMPIFGWKGSYVVSLVGAEKEVSYDNGPDSSVAEDTFFGLLAASRGYSFSFIHGEMWEKSPFTVMDFIQQRKRWLQGLILVAHSSQIPIRYRILLAISVYSWLMAPLMAVNALLQPMFPLVLPRVVNSCVSFIGSVWIYLYFYGTVRSFSVSMVGIVRFIMFILMGILVTPFKLLIEIVAVVWGISTPKHTFFVVKKDIVKIV